MEEVIIQKMTEVDLPQVMAIEQASFPTPFTLNLFKMELNLNVAHLYVARLKGNEGESPVVGYIDFWRVGPEAHVITIAVHPSFRKRGIASRLIEFMLEEGRRNDVETISLDVRPSNSAGLGLYQRFGFRQIGVRKGYYQDNDEDALVLSLPLKEPQKEEPRESIP